MRQTLLYVPAGRGAVAGRPSGGKHRQAPADSEDTRFETGEPFPNKKHLRAPPRAFGAALPRADASWWVCLLYLISGRAAVQKPSRGDQPSGPQAGEAGEGRGQERLRQEEAR